MNYIELINDFWQTRRKVRLTSAEADLYFCLLQECNLRGWENPFECPNRLICALINIDEKTLLRARNGLQQKGFITFEKGLRKAKSPVYRLLYLQNSCINAGIIGGITGGKTGGKNSDVPIYRSLSKDKDGYKLNKKENSKVPLTGNDELPFDKEEISDNFFEKVKSFFNTHCKALRPVCFLTDKRKQSISARKREYGEEAIFDMLTRAGNSRFLAGQNPRGWCADFDWLFKPLNFVKVLENKFVDEEQTTSVGRGAAGSDKERRDRAFAEHITSKMRAASESVPATGNAAPDF